MLDDKDTFSKVDVLDPEQWFASCRVNISLLLHVLDGLKRGGTNWWTFAKCKAWFIRNALYIDEALKERGHLPDDA